MEHKKVQHVNCLCGVKSAHNKLTIGNENESKTLQSSLWNRSAGLITAGVRIN